MNYLLFFTWWTQLFVLPTLTVPGQTEGTRDALFSHTLPMETFPALWKKADSLAAKQLYDQALVVSNAALKKAVAESDDLQRYRAICYVGRFQMYITEKSDSLNVALIREHIPQVKGPARGLLTALLANAYSDYLNSNRWRILSRTNTEIKPEDFQAWGVQAFNDEVIRLYLEAVQPEYQQIPLASVKDYLTTGKDSERYRPTLYDVLAFEAIDYFAQISITVVQPQAVFSLPGEAAFAPAKTFAELKLDSKDPGSPQYHTLGLFQQVTRFHLNDKDPSALYDLELKRLDYVRDETFSDQKTDWYRQALEKLISTYPNHPISAEAHYRIAQLDMEDGGMYEPLKGDAHRYGLRDAHKRIVEAQKKYPDNRIKGNLEATIRDLESKEISIQIEEANLPDQPFRGYLSWKNLPVVYCRLIAVDPTEWWMRSPRDKEVKALLRTKPVQEWAVNLPATGDFQVHATEFKVPALKTGTYALLVGSDKSFKDGTIIQYAPFQVTPIAWMTRSDGAETRIQVLHRATGKAIANATVQFWQQRYDSPRLERAGAPVTTDANGEASFGGMAQYNAYTLEIISGKDKAYGNWYAGYYQETPEVNRRVTHFFTDRAIYRPGQEVLFKVVLMDLIGTHHQLVPNTEVKVTLNDANAQEVAKLTLRTNDYGSATGKFTLPTGGLTGNFTLESEGQSHSIRVEEYKRPKFEVTLDPPAGAPKVGETVKATGKAMTYAGAPVAGAKVAYRVRREVRFPYWFSWWGSPSSPAREIVNGEALTKDDGSFEIEFEAIPDPSVDKKQLPVFTYALTATVTDIAGESHDATQRVRAGYVSVELDAEFPETVDVNAKNPVTLSAVNLNGNPAPVSGKLELIALKAPAQALRNRPWPQPDMQVMSQSEFRKTFPNEQYAAENDSRTWPENGSAGVWNFNTAETTQPTLAGFEKLPAGRYKWVLTAADPSGAALRKEGYLTCFTSPKDFPVTPAWLETDAESVVAEPGETAKIRLFTSEKEMVVRYLLTREDKVLSTQTLVLKRGMNEVAIPIAEGYRGNVYAQFYSVKENQAFNLQTTVAVPWSNKELQLSWATFRDKLQPGATETWKLTIRGPQKEAVAAELVATMYDASLETYASHRFDLSLNPTYSSWVSWQSSQAFQTRYGNGLSYIRRKDLPENNLPVYPDVNTFGLAFGYGSRQYAMNEVVVAASGRPMPRMLPGGRNRSAEREEMAADARLAPAPMAAMADSDGVANFKNAEPTPPEPEPQEVLSGPVQIRTNLQETAFFFPQMETDAEGNVTLNFTMPEALTRWKFLGLAYTKDLKTGSLTGQTVTQKELMVTPNLPRFLRENDGMTLTAKIDNLSEGALSGTASLQILDAFTRQPLNAAFGVGSSDLSFEVDVKNSAVVKWQIRTPETTDAVVVQVIARAATFSDGEENVLPILKNRILVTETLPLSVRGGQSRDYRFEKLLKSDKSSTLQHRQLALEFTPNPVWYAVQSLPYLMEYPHECTEQIFSRFYANAIASHVANSQPKIKEVFDTWKAGGAGNEQAFVSQLDKNPDLRNALMSETPWVLNARSESERKQRVGVLFDLHRMGEEKSKAYQVLTERQMGNGAFSWFPGMPESRYVTTLVVTGIGRLNKLGVNASNPEVAGIVQKALPYLDRELKQEYEDLKRSKVKMEDNNLSYSAIYHLYARSFFPDIPLASGTEQAFAYFAGQAKTYWTKQSRYSQGMLALTFHRSQDVTLAREVVNGLAGSAVRNAEQGMYWKSGSGWYWYEAPIEQQALLIEAFAETGLKPADVEEMKIWLLNQKRTQDWGATRATADACYALLLTGIDVLSEEPGVEIRMGKEKINPATDPSIQAEAGTGNFRKTWSAAEIDPAMGSVKVSKKGKGIAWGGIFWQYFEQLDKITPATTSLNLRKELFREEMTPSGPVLKPISPSQPIKVGDKVVARVEIRTDRTLEYVHLKDLRAAGFEPVELLSGYRYKSGLGYYQSIKDASMNFFFERVPAGTHVFEYALRVTHTGNFSGGIATVQCMYAPEFTSHTEGGRVVVE